MTLFIITLLMKKTKGNVMRVKKRQAKFLSIKKELIQKYFRESKKGSQGIQYKSIIQKINVIKGGCHN